MNRIRELRQSRGWTQAQLGDQIGAVKSTVSGYESETHQIDVETLHRLCDLFGCTADYLLGRSVSPDPAVSASDAELLRIYHALPLEIRRAVDGLMAPYRTEAKEKTGS